MVVEDWELGMCVQVNADVECGTSTQGIIDEKALQQLSWIFLPFIEQNKTMVHDVTEARQQKTGNHVRLSAP